MAPVTRKRVPQKQQEKENIRPRTHHPRASSASRKEKKRLYQMQYRAKLKQNEQQYEQHKMKERDRKKLAKTNGQVKGRQALTNRQLRAVRKRNKEAVAKHRRLKKEASAAAAETEAEIAARAAQEGRNDQPPVGASTSYQRLAGQKVRKRTLVLLNAKLRKLAEELKRERRKTWRIRRRLTRQRSKIPLNELSPVSRTNRLLGGKKVPQQVIQELKFSSALQCELKYSSSLLKGHKEKRVMNRIISGRVLKNYRMLKQIKTFQLTSLRMMRNARKGQAWRNPLQEMSKPERGQHIIEAIRKFYLSDTASSACPYKREYKTVDGQRQQKRFLNDTLRVLYRTYIATMPFKTSYAVFCRYRPKWVVARKLSGRDTCLCKKCENFKLLHASAFSVKIVNAKDAAELVKSMCCTEKKETCLLGTCNQCNGKTITFLPCNTAHPVMYRKWVDVKESRLSTKKKDDKGNFVMINVKVTKKVEVYTTIEELQNLLNNLLRPHMEHIGRIEHQRTSVKQLRSNLSDKDLYIHCDWSQDYEGKYGSEPQSTHFGGSRPHFALHTGRAVTRNMEESFCTISMCTRHDPAAIAAHLKPVLSDYLGKDPQVNHLHFLSDGPVTQYRNSTLYFLLTQHLMNIFKQIKFITWNVSEAGHGKGEADAVGGSLKGAADEEVAHGKDIASMEKLVGTLNRKCPSIKLHTISLEDIQRVDNIAVPKLKGSVKGVLQMHQYKWTRENPKELHFKSLSCYNCHREMKCNHYVLQQSWKFPGSSQPKPKKVPNPRAVSNSRPRNLKKPPAKRKEQDHQPTRSSKRLRNN